MTKPKIRYDIIIELDGMDILDSLLSRLLLEVKNKGSIIKASQSLGIPYSKAWDMINKAERKLGEKLVETWKGGGGRGGAKLTARAEELLEAYLAAESRLASCIGPLFPKSEPIKTPSIIIAYSHDHIIEVAIGKLSDNYSVEGVCGGSLRSLAMLSLGEADIACIHLFEPESGSFNRNYLEKYYVEHPVLLGGFEREIVLVYRNGLDIESIDEAVKLLGEGELKLVNRNPGSGTRLLLDYILRKYSVDSSRIRGYNNVKYTHEEVVREIAFGRSDVGLAARYYSELYGLNSIHLIWEKYECYTTRNKVGKRGVLDFKHLLNSDEIKGFIEKLPGYRLL